MFNIMSLENPTIHSLLLLLLLLLSRFSRV